MDIALCTDSACPMRDTCKRWEGHYEELSEYQAYSYFDRQDNYCDGYWEKE